MSISTEEYLHYCYSDGIKETDRKKVVEDYNRDLLNRYPWLRITSKYTYAVAFFQSLKIYKLHKQFLPRAGGAYHFH